jgi:phosphopantothenoylcysteine synthetase/decarboxylase
MSRLDKKNIYYIITGAPKAKYAHDIIKEMISEGAEGFTDLHILREIIGNIVKNDWDNNIKLPKEDAVLIAPCTFNTLNAIVSGRSDSYALSIIASAIGHKTPVFIAPAMNKSL